MFINVNQLENPETIETKAVEMIIAEMIIIEMIEMIMQDQHHQKIISH